MGLQCAAPGFRGDRLEGILRIVCGGGCLEDIVGVVIDNWVGPDEALEVVDIGHRAASIVFGLDRGNDDIWSTLLPVKHERRRRVHPDTSPVRKIWGGGAQFVY